MDDVIKCIFIFFKRKYGNTTCQLYMSSLLEMFFCILRVTSFAYYELINNIKILQKLQSKCDSITL